MLAPRSISRPLHLIACTMLMILAPAASAQESHNPAEECIEHIGIITHRSIQTSQSIAEHTVDAIIHLDNEDSPEVIMRHAANDGKQAIENRAQAASERIAALVERCVVNLREHDAPARVIASVVHAGQWGASAIEESARRNTARINRALRIALNN